SHVGVVLASIDIRGGIGRGCRGKGQRVVVGHRHAVIVAGGGEGEDQRAVGDFGRGGRVRGVHIARTGAEGAVAAAPHRASGHGEAARKGGRGIVRAEALVRAGVYRRGRGDGVCHLVAHRVAKAVAGAGQRKGDRACCALRSTGRVRRVGCRVARVVCA